MTFTLITQAFADKEEINKRYTCDGEDLFPGLSWSGVPKGTKSFALICHDPDVPEELRSNVPDLIWDHLIIVNIPSDISELPEGRIELPEGAKFLKNSWGKYEYGGPCPPNPLHHRYFFNLYALDCVLQISDTATKRDLLEMMDKHIIAKAGLMCRYLREQFRSDNAAN